MTHDDRHLTVTHDDHCQNAMHERILLDVGCANNQFLTDMSTELFLKDGLLEQFQMGTGREPFLKDGLLEQFQMGTGREPFPRDDLRELCLRDTDMALYLTRMNRVSLMKRYHTVQYPRKWELALFRKSKDTVLFRSRWELGRCQTNTGKALCQMDVELAPCLKITDMGLFPKIAALERFLKNLDLAPSRSYHKALN